MSLPWIFASLTTIISSYWDDNYAALGALTPIPCGVTGTNALALSPLANTPSVSAYGNYMQFTGIVAATNSGATTAAVGSLGAKPVYRDTGGGPVALSGGELVTGTAFTLMYDTTLNSGGGGWHLSSSVVSGSFLPTSGGTLSGPLSGTTVSLSGPLTAASASVTGALTGASASISGVARAVSIVATGGITASTGTIAGNFGAATVTATDLVVGAGATVTRLLTALSTVTFTALNPQTTQDQTVTLTGVSVGDVVMAAPPSAPTIGLVLATPFVSANNSVVLRYANPTTNTLTPPAGAYRTTAIGTA